MYFYCTVHNFLPTSFPPPEIKTKTKLNTLVTQWITEIPVVLQTYPLFCKHISQKTRRNIMITIFYADKIQWFFRVNLGPIFGSIPIKYSIYFPPISCKNSPVSYPVHAEKTFDQNLLRNYQNMAICSIAWLIFSSLKFSTWRVNSFLFTL